LNSQTDAVAVLASGENRTSDVDAYGRAKRQYQQHSNNADSPV
jgi:hypothetical protein